MVRLSIKCFILLIILSQLSAAAESIDNGGLNVSVVVIDTSGNPISDALIKATGTSDIPVLKLTDSKGKAELEITKGSSLTIEAKGYQDWVSREAITPGTLMLTLESSATNTNFNIKNTKSEFVRKAFVIVEDSAGNKVVKISDADGKVSAQVSLGRANITVKADGYEEFNDNSAIISRNATYTYVLNPSIGRKTILLNLIALMLPFLLMLYVSLVERSEKYYHWYAYSPTIGWVVSFALLIYTAVDAKDYNIYFLDPTLKVSLFVPIAAFLGATSYITVSILNNIKRKPLTSNWKLIYFAYGRRLLMAPYIAIIALFTITELAQLKNPWAVLFFAYFVGLYTKEIEGTLEEIGRKFLTEKQKILLEESEKKASEIVKRLGVSTGIVVKLGDQGIKNISDLLAITNEKIKEAAEKAGLEKDYLSGLKEKAKEQDNNIKTMKEKLGLDHDLLSMLVDAGIYSMSELSQIEGNCLSEIAANIGINKDCLGSLVNKAKSAVKEIGR